MYMRNYCRIGKSLTCLRQLFGSPRSTSGISDMVYMWVCVQLASHGCDSAIQSRFNILLQDSKRTESYLSAQAKVTSRCFV